MIEVAVAVLRPENGHSVFPVTLFLFLVLTFM